MAVVVVGCGRKKKRRIVAETLQPDRTLIFSALAAR
jgi:hypothetical protein